MSEIPADRTFSVAENAEIDQLMERMSRDLKKNLLPGENESSAYIGLVPIHLREEIILRHKLSGWKSINLSGCHLYMAKIVLSTKKENRVPQNDFLVHSMVQNVERFLTTNYKRGIKDHYDVGNLSRDIVDQVVQILVSRGWKPHRTKTALCFDH